MTHKLKLLLFGMIGLLTFSTVPTYAVTFKGDSSSAKMISGYNNFSYQDYSNGFYGCIWDNYKTNANLQRESSGCSDGYYTVRGHYSSYGALRINNSPISSYGGYKLRNKQDSPDIFSLLKYRNGEETIYRKITMKNLATKMLSVKSQRGENVYDEAFVDGLGFVALVKDQNQVRAAHVIANSYILDGYLLAVRSFDSYILDTYTNKIYKYNNNFYSSEMQREGVAQIFPKLWNTVPDQVSDVVRGLPSRNKVTVNSQDLSFDFSNTQTGTKATLSELRENIRKSITILDQEGAEFFLGETPESYGIGAGSPNTDNQLNTSGATTPKTGGAEEKKACVDYYTDQKAYTAHSAGCRGDNTTGEQFEYWQKITYGEYQDYNARDKARYWRCWQFANFREKMEKKYKDQFMDSFHLKREEKYFMSKPEDVDINAMCSHIAVSNPKFEPLDLENVKKAGSAIISRFTKSGIMVQVGSGEVSQYELDKLIGKYYSYDKACREKTYLPTPNDSILSYVVGYDFFFNATNNEKVCQYRDQLYKEILAKYSNSSIQKEYREALKEELELNFITGENANIFNNDGGIDGEKLKQSSSKNQFSPVGLNSSELGLSNLFTYFSKDYQAGIDKSYNLLGYTKCGQGIGIKERDYILWIFVFIFGYELLKGKK